MADIRTHLRELSVGIYIGCSQQNISASIEGLTPQNFLNLANKVFATDMTKASNILELPNFSTPELDIIKNGYKLGKLIDEKLAIKKNDLIHWYGRDTQKDNTIDLQIGERKFSLKEESFILENMGLSKYLSLITGKAYRRGLHVFKEFSKDEYEAWFLYTWKKFTQAGSKGIKNNISNFTIHGGNVIMSWVKKSVTVPCTISSTDEFMFHTNSTIRDRVFAKWIRESLQSDKAYIALKKKCSEVAGEHLCKIISENLNEEHLKRFLQIRSEEYYYAKSTPTETLIYMVPNAESFDQQITIDNVGFSVPRSQLNIETTIKNTTTGKTLKIRNECRFSHGQFNGTPEAKMYYDKSEDISAIYTLI